MKQILLLILMISTGFSMQAQLEFEQAEVSKTFTAGVDHDIETDLPLSNVGSDDMNFIWHVVTESAPAEWKFFICDLKKCYGPGTESIDADAANSLAAELTKSMKFHLLPSSTEGEGTYVLNLTDVNNTENILATVTLYFNGTPVSTNEEMINEITIFPNPVNDYFELKNEGNLASSIEIFDILGKRVKSFSTDASNYYVGDIAAGRYFARILDAEGQSLKVVRLMKRGNNP